MFNWYGLEKGMSLDLFSIWVKAIFNPQALGRVFM